METTSVASDNSRVLMVKPSLVAYSTDKRSSFVHEIVETHRAVGNYVQILFIMKTNLRTVLTGMKFLRNKSYQTIFAKHCLERQNKKDRSPCSPKKCWANFTPFMPELVLITHVIASVHITFCGS